MTLTFTADTDEAVLAERVRQIEDKGYTPEHDDAHTLRELAACADMRLAEMIENSPHVARTRLTEVRAVLLATIESAERRIAAAQVGDVTTADVIRAFTEWRRAERAGDAPVMLGADDLTDERYGELAAMYLAYLLTNRPS